MIGQTTLSSRTKEPLVAKLSLISLMDIFTILVFFLMINSGETQNIETVKVIELPDSIAGKSPHAELTIFVSEEHIIFNKEQIAEVAPIKKSPDEPIEALVTLLSDHIESLGDDAKVMEKVGFAITIMADKSVNYEVLKSVMETCREKNYRNISLAVNRVQPEIELQAHLASTNTTSSEGG